MVRVRCSLKSPDSLWRSLLIISQTKTSPPRVSSVGSHTQTHTRCTRPVPAQLFCLLEPGECTFVGHMFTLWAKLACLAQLCSISGVLLNHSFNALACTLARSRSQWAYTHVHIHICTQAGFTQASYLSLLRGKPQQPQRLVRHIYV